MAFLGADRVIQAAVATLRAYLLSVIRENEAATGLDLREVEYRTIWKLGAGATGLAGTMSATLRRLDGGTLVAADEPVTFTETDDPGTYSISFRPEHNAVYHLEANESTGQYKTFDEYQVSDAEPIYLPYPSNEPGPHGAPVLIEVFERLLQSEQPYVDAETQRIRSELAFDVLLTFGNQTLDQLEPLMRRARLWQAAVIQVLHSHTELGDDCIINTAAEAAVPHWEIEGEENQKSLRVTANVRALSRVEERHA